MTAAGLRVRSLGVVGVALWASLVFACSDPPPPEPPPQPARPACNGMLQTTCLPPMLIPPGACLPAAQVGGQCTGMYALSEGTLGPAGCCYSVCVGIPGQCGPGGQPGQPGMQGQQPGYSQPGYSQPGR